MGREEGGGFRMGNTCIPVTDSFRYLAKPIQYCKVKKIKKKETATRVPDYLVGISGQPFLGLITPQATWAQGSAGNRHVRVLGLSSATPPT